MYNDYSLLGENGNVYLPNDFYDENKLAEYIVNKVVHGDCKKYSDDECIKTITKVLDALGMSASVILQNTQAIDKNVIVYIVAVINEFAKTYHISVREANNYLICFIA